MKTINLGGRPRLPEHLRRKRVTVSIRAELARAFKSRMKRTARYMEKAPVCLNCGDSLVHPESLVGFCCKECEETFKT